MSIILRPFVAFALFFCAAVIGRFILRKMRPGALRDALSKPLYVMPRTDAQRQDWTPVVWLIVASLLVFTVIWFTDPLHH